MSFKITGLYYITHVDNLASILEHGIMSHQVVRERNIEFKPIYDENIVNNRQHRIIDEGKNLWHYTNLYFNARNPMLFRVIQETGVDKLIIIKVKKQVLNQPNVFLSDGNAAHSNSQLYPFKQDLLKMIVKNVDLDYWKDIDGSKRKIMAECLVPEIVPASFIECVYTSSQNGALQNIRKIVANSKRTVEVLAEPNMFFKPIDQSLITNKLFLATGDLFFSRMQTLTISVNTVGVMGRGLASRAKYQFPDVYVTYQDLCKNKKISIGLPALVKTELSLISELSENFTEQSSSSTWFLLFPTKKHWKENSKLEYIVDGLVWLHENFKKEGITSLALPALGCGLGNLDWGDVGPIMCSSLAKFDIPVCIYLPTEKKIPPEQRTPQFLIRS